MRHRLVYAYLCSFMLAASVLATPLQMVANSYPPLTDQRLPYNGLATDLVSSALSRAGFASEYHEEPWARALQGLQRDKHDLIIAAWYSAERLAYGQYSDPYLINKLRFIRKKGSPIDYQQLSDLRPYLISVIRGYAYTPAFNADNSLQKYPVNSFASAARMVAQGHAQLALEDELVAQYAFNGELRDVREQLEFVPKSLAESPLYILVRRSHPQHQQIIDGFNTAMRAMREDGSYKKILQRHAQD